MFGLPSTFQLILGVINIGAKIFSDERQRYYESEAKKLQEEIFSVADSQFYSKDMEAKGKAERELYRRSENLAAEFIKEGNK